MDICNIAIELGDGQVVNVDLNDRNSQLDLTWARHIMINPQSRWDVMSAFHKSLRLGNFNLSLNRGRLFALKSSPHVVLKYLRKILWEETRNLDLFFRLSKGDLGYEESIILFCASRKKWELLYYNDHFNNWNKGYLRFITRKKNNESFDYSDLSSVLDQVKDKVEIYELNDFLQERKDLDGLFYETLKQKFPENLLLHNVINLRNSDFGSRYYRMVVLEIAFGVWKEEGNEYHQIPDKTPFYIPARRLWYFDYHTKSAKKLIVENYNQLRPGKGYNFPALDLRLSGMLLGIGYRFRVKKPLEHQWFEVELSDTEWLELKAHEQSFYNI